jgi:plastocyanin/cytochrome c5
MRREWIARIVLLLILVGLPTLILGYQFWIRQSTNSIRVIDILAASPEAGGFQPDSIQVEAGQTVTLRFTAVDVTHGIAIGPGLGVDLGDVDPGHVREITLTFDQAGTFTFYCNTWCSPNHWRMRGILSIYDPEHAVPTPQHDPVIEQLIAEGVDIDAAHQVNHTSPYGIVSPPSIEQGAELALTLILPMELQDLTWRRTHSPEQALPLLIADNASYAQSDLSNVVAYMWLRDITVTPETVRLYEQNCAACHGQSGDGNGFAASTTAVLPVAFADFSYMWTRRSDVLYAKIRRGGMGTDMPNFGTVFTSEETWALVDYLWSLSISDSRP